MNHEHSQEEKFVRLNGWGSPRVLWFLYKERKVREKKGFVRGTTSFYNKKLQILPVREGVLWNV